MHYPLFLGKHVVDDEYTNWLYKPFYFLSVVFGFVNTQGPFTITLSGFQAYPGPPSSLIDIDTKHLPDSARKHEGEQRMSGARTLTLLATAWSRLSLA